MSWPSPQDYNEAIQTPSTSFSDPDLRSGQVELSPIGIPRVVTGAFASVYKVGTGNGDWAVRCFLTDRPGQKERYETISKHVLLDNLDYTVEFHYLEEGIQVRRKWFPVLKMTWVYGQTLESFLIDNFDDPEEVIRIRDQFFDLAKKIDEAEMAHGDLQHGNIIVTEQGLRLVDYDAMFVPDLLGKTCLELGHPNYQHPLRTEHHYDRTVDNFSCWLIYLSLSIVALDYEMFKEFYGGDECILFRKKDLQKPEQSKVFQRILNHEITAIREHGTTIMRMLWSTPQLIPELYHPEELTLLPEVKPENFSLSGDSPVGTHKEDESLGVDSENKFQKDLNLGWSTTDRPEIAKGKRRVRKSIKGVFKATAAKVADAISNAQKAVAPHTWCETVILEGDQFYRNGDPEKAVEKYLIAFKEAYKHKANDYDRDFLIEISLKLADTLSSLNNDNLATNYFYVAYKQSCRRTRPVERDIGLAAFLLSLNRFRKGDIDEVVQLFKDDPRLSKSLAYLVDFPKFQEPRVLEMLLRVYEELRSHPDPELPKRCMSGLLYLQEKLGSKDGGIGWIKASILYLEMADLSLQQEDMAEAVRHYLKFVSLCGVDGVGTSIDFAIPAPAEDISGGLDELTTVQLELASVVERKKKTLRVFYIAHSFALAASFEQFKNLVENMEGLSPDQIYSILQYRYSVKPEKTKLAPLLMIQAEVDTSVRYAVFQKALASLGDVEDIAAYLEFLSEKNLKGARIGFEKIFLPACESKKINKVGRLVSNAAYKDCVNLFETAVVEVGTMEDVLRHLKLLDRVFETKYARDIVIALIERRTLHFALNLLLSLAERGFKRQVDSIYVDKVAIFSRVYGSRANITDICLYAELLVALERDDVAKDLISEVVRVNNESVLFTMISITQKRKNDYYLKVLWFIYLGTLSSSKTFILVALESEVIERLFHFLHVNQDDSYFSVFLQDFYRIFHIYPEIYEKSRGRFTREFGRAMLKVYKTEPVDLSFKDWQYAVAVEVKKKR